MCSWLYQHNIRFNKIIDFYTPWSPTVTQEVTLKAGGDRRHDRGGRGDRDIRAVNPAIRCDRRRGGDADWPWPPKVFELLTISIH